MSNHLEFLFPNLKYDDYEIKSDATYDYNCIAWAAGDMEKCWWPSRFRPYPERQYYWPRGLPRVRTLDNFVRAFKMLGYEPCEGPDLEPGFEKVAIYVDGNGAPTHMARQLETGIWTSKLGYHEDIEHHKLKGVEGSSYGTAVQYLRRPR